MFHFIILFLKKVKNEFNFFRNFMQYLKYLVIIMAICSCSSKEEYRNDLIHIFDTAAYSGCFMVYDIKTDMTTYVNRERCFERFSPASTFKIPNSLIALETKAVQSDKDTIRYNGIEKPIPDWNRDHDLASAFKYSVVWYYKDIANRIGDSTMKIWLDTLTDYGTMVRASKIDEFWLDGSLKISANEQVKFLTKLYKNELPFSPRTVGIVKDMMMYNQDGNYTIRGKTGASIADNVGWFVGWVETKDNAKIFALNISVRDSLDSQFMRDRIELTYKFLRELNILK